MKIKKVVLVDPAIPDKIAGAKGPGFREEMEQIGIRYIAASLKKAGYQVSIISQENKTIEQVYAQIREMRPSVIGFTVFTGAYENAEQIARLVKENLNIPTIAGGVHISTDYYNLSRYFDIGVVGEGEETIISILKCLEEEKPISTVKGIAYHSDDGRVIFTGHNERILRLDNITFPVRDVNSLMKLTGQLPRPHDAKGYASLISSRGCQGRCTFCINEKMWRSCYTSRSVKNIVDEIEELNKKGINYFWFGDENFTQDKQRVIAFRVEIFKRQKEGKIGRIYWAVMGRVNNMDDEILRAMKESGCVQVGYGIETADKNILKSYRKGISLDNAKEVIRKTNHMGITTAAYFKIGAINVTYDSLETTKNFILNELEAVRIRIAFVYPFPGTRLREEVDEQDKWISEKHKGWEYATAELPVIKCEVSEADLIRFQSETTEEYYKSERYDSIIQSVIKGDPEMRKTLEDWMKIIGR